LYGAIVSVVLVKFPLKGDRVQIVGSACVVIGVLMYAAPLSVMVMNTLCRLILSLTSYVPALYMYTSSATCITESVRLALI
jgi:hypothetical protein